MRRFWLFEDTRLVPGNGLTAVMSVDHFLFVVFFLVAL